MFPFIHNMPELSDNDIQIVKNFIIFDADVEDHAIAADTLIKEFKCALDSNMRLLEEFYGDKQPVTCV